MDLNHRMQQSKCCALPNLAMAHQNRKTRNRTKVYCECRYLRVLKKIVIFGGNLFAIVFPLNYFPLVWDRLRFSYFYLNLFVIPTLLQFIFKVRTPFRPPTATKGLTQTIGLEPIHHFLKRLLEDQQSPALPFRLMSAIMRFINHLLYDICCTIVSNAHTSLNYFQRTIHYRTNIAITCIFLSPRIKFFTNNACEITVICFRWKIKYFYKIFFLQFQK